MDMNDSSLMEKTYTDIPILEKSSLISPTTLDKTTAAVKKLSAEEPKINENVILNDNVAETKQNFGKKSDVLSDITDHNL